MAAAGLQANEVPLDWARASKETFIEEDSEDRFPLPQKHANLGEPG